MATSTYELDGELKALLAAAAETHGPTNAKHATTCFAYLGVQHISDVTHYSRYDYIRVPRCGRRTAALIEEVARLAGASLREGDAPSVPLRPPPAELSLFTKAVERFFKAYRDGQPIALTPTEVAALGSLLILAQKQSVPAGR